MQIISSNFTTLIVSVGNLDVNNQSILIGSNLGVYAPNINLSSDSAFSSYAYGCLGTKGAGGGIVDILMRLNLLCGGPGGSHGSQGGSPASEKEEY